MAGFGLLVVGLAVAYWLVRQAGQASSRSLNSDAR
jgi:protein-S-isoprenylcysteine O-methyltransferase Ste14